jgi:hypothetical protein
MNLAVWAERNGVGGAGDRVGHGPADPDGQSRHRSRVCANGHRCKFLALLRDPAVTRVVVEHRDRFCRFGSEYLQAALAAQGRELVVVDSAEVDDDLVRDMTEILTSMCARLYENGLRRTGSGERSPPPLPPIARRRDSDVRDP